MKIKEGFLLRSVAGSNVAVPVGDRCADFNGMITLNETGAFLWRLLEKGTEEPELIAALQSEYHVERELAEASVTEFVEKLQRNELLG